MVEDNLYLIQENDQYYCLLPSHLYKEIPYINWVEDIDWQYVYYTVYKYLIKNMITNEQLRQLNIKEILDIIDVRI